MGYIIGATPLVASKIEIADLKLDNISFQPGRTVDPSLISGDCWYAMLGKMCVIHIAIGLRFGEAGASSTLYFGLPTAIPRFRNFASTAFVDSLWQATSGPVGFVRALVARDTFENGRNHIQLTGYTTTIGTTSAWPITPTARRAIAGTLVFPTD
jgi:hypothetical protein